MKKKILIVDDEIELRRLINKLLKMEGYVVSEANDAEEAFEMIKKEDFSVVLSDIKMPGISGLDLLSMIKDYDSSIEVIMLTAYGRIEDGVDSIKRGAFDYITKGDDDNKIIPVVAKAFEKIALKNKIDQLEKRIGEKYSFDSISGNSQKIKEVRDLAKRVAGTDVPVLISGETGTGKEILAQAIHNGSNRCHATMVTINCSAIPKDLIESELFGYKAGAFTGALKNKKGLFEEAHTGTLFLDEIGELEPSAQSKLLRVIESNSFLKTGDTVETKVDVRIIAATNRNLEMEISKGNFRSDLFYRLSVFNIHLPPLRARSEDIAQITMEMVNSLKIKMKYADVPVGQDFMDHLQKYDFPGNIRELRNILERGLILSQEGRLTKKQLPSELQNHFHPEEGVITLEDIEKEHILKTLHSCGFNKTKTASILGIGVATLYRKLEHYGITTEK
ncbi:sigma-54 dependent transcriptional regulator [Ignavibacteriales bacterium]